MRLSHSGLPREPREYFAGAADASFLDLLPPTRRGEALGRELPDYLAEGTTPNGVFGAKLMPRVVEYETFAADHAATLRAVLACLGLQAENTPEPPLRRQGDDRSDR